MLWSELYVPNRQKLDATVGFQLYMYIFKGNKNYNVTATLVHIVLLFKKG